MRYVLAFLLSAIVGFLGYLQFYPYWRTKNILRQITGNEFYHARWYYIPLLGDEERRVQRVSPDLLYSYCLFDLSEGNYKIRLAKWNGYQSMSVYGMDGSHHSSFVSNGDALDIELSQEDDSVKQGFIMARRSFAGLSRSEEPDLCEVLP